MTQEFIGTVWICSDYYWQQAAGLVRVDDDRPLPTIVFRRNGDQSDFSTSLQHNSLSYQQDKSFITHHIQSSQSVKA